MISTIASKTSIALIHYPVYDKDRRVVSTAITILDLHDIARVARTFGVERFYVITPLKRQQWLVDRVLSHWMDGFGARYNPNRKEALSLISLVETLENTIEDLGKRWSLKPKTVMTAARKHKRCIDFAELRERMKQDSGPYLISFGTGWGLTDELLSQSDYILTPIRGGTDYNHLSVRSAVAITIDRLFGDR